MSQIRHRHVLIAPFVLIFVVTLLGGLVNDMTAQGVVVDDVSGEAVEGTRIIHGTRETRSDAQGRFALANVPRTSKLEVRPPAGYQLTTVATTVEEIRLNPLSITIYAHEEGKTREEAPVPNPQARDLANTKIIGTGNASGQIVIAPHPATEEGGRVTRVLLCGEGYEPKEIDIEGVLMVVPLKAGGSGCPPLPTPTPDPNATPTPTPAPEATPTPTPSPTPTGAP